MRTQKQTEKERILYHYFNRRNDIDILDILKSNECCTELNELYLKYPRLDKHGNKMKSQKNNPYIFAFDIETTKTTDDKLHRVKELDTLRSKRNKPVYKVYTFLTQFTVSALETKTGKVVHFYHGRYIEELFNIFDSIMKLPYQTMVYSHNYGGYESHLLNQYEWIEERTESLLANSPSKILTQRLHTDDYCGNIQICDSLLILQKSISVLGNELGLPKLDYDYDKFILPTDKVSKKEIEYNYRDNDICLLAIYNKVKLYPWLNNDKWINSKKIPISATGFVRKEIKLNPNINTKWIYNDWCSQCKEQFIRDQNIYECITDSFNGGYVHGNPYYIGKVLHKVTSIDFKSSYPGVMLNKFYPKTCFESVDVSEFETVLKPKLLECVNNWRSCVSMTNICNSAYVGTFIFKNIKYKTFQNKNVFPIIASSKSKSKTCNGKLFSENTVLDNGKVLFSDLFYGSYTDVELLSIFLTYNFDSVECIELYRADSVGFMHEAIQNAIIYFGEQKTEWKKIISDIENGRDYTNRKVPGEQMKALNESDDKLNLANMYLMNSKQNLNSIYGMQVQKPIQDDYVLQDLAVQLVEKSLENAVEEIEDSTVNHSFSVGIYVTAWARLMLVLGFYEIVANGGTWIYADTDSLKFISNGNYENIKNAIDEFNNVVVTNSNNKFKFGIFDFETLDNMDYSYRDFVTLGAKKYMVTEFNNKTQKWEIHTTIAGLPKGCASIWQTKYDELNGDFDLLVSEYFHHNILIDSSLTNKLEHNETYKHEDMRTKYKNIGGKLPIYSMVNLLPTSFDMNSCIGSISSTNYYCNVLETLFSNKQHTERRLIK